MIVDNDGDAELFSPDGRCNHVLSKTPLTAGDFNAVLFYYNDTVMACAPQQSCWKYDIKYDNWTRFSQASYKQYLQTGAVVKNNLYVIDADGLHILDLTTSAWSSHSRSDSINRRAHTIFGWKDSITMIGGDGSTQSVFTFDVRKQTWSSRRSTPFPITWASTLMINENEILLAGSWYADTSVATYFPSNDTWIKLAASDSHLKATRLVKLNQRIFGIGDLSSLNSVKEFSSSTNTWSLITTKLKNSYNGRHSVIALEDTLFSHMPGGCTGVF